jgi:nucleotide-binding universal stress UspA family protein
MKISKILVPTDFSDLSLHAVRYAKEFAATFRAQIHCVHVIDEAYQYWSTMGPESAPVGPAVEDLRSLAEGHMQRFADEHMVGLDYVPVMKVISGTPWSDICQYALENTVDLIVVATHGRGGLAHALLGSTTEKVIRKAPCPVLVVREAEHDFVRP